jgi:bifunctional UDP-N-acetylglucosamine pyrophosphorylase/glucosamine-1-phosphate N-acetyltransferase
MRSAYPKLLHPIGGVSMFGRLLETVRQINPLQIIAVYGHQGEQLKEAFGNNYPSLMWVTQKEPLGTGHATLQALPCIKDAVDKVLVLYGDIPLITAETLNHLLQTAAGSIIGLITTEMHDPTGFGRVIRDPKGKILRIVEEKDATLGEKQVKEINTGFFLVAKSHLQRWLPKLSAQNNQQEYYLPDIVAMASAAGMSVTNVIPRFKWEVMGVNDKVQLAMLERLYQSAQASQLLEQGVTLLDPARFDVRGHINVGSDVVIDVNVILEGRVTLGNNVTIGPNVYIKDAVIQDGTQILANTVIEGATIGAGCSIGPLARIRPGTVLANGVQIGNFVEIKNTSVNAYSKVNHLSYVGDASIGQKVNIGAGTITCNFDGKKKHKTVIQDHVLVGAGTQLIAPVTVGENVTIGAGTTVTRDVPAHHLIHNHITHRIAEKQTEVTELNEQS